MVRKEMSKKTFLLFCVVVFAISSKGSLSGIDDETYILGLRYPNSYAAKTYPQRADMRGIGYNVCLSFPSKGVLRFYDDKLKEIGWVPFEQPYHHEYNREWMNYIDGTIEGHPLVHQLYAEWVDKEKIRMVVLVIRYYSFYLNREEKMYAQGEPNNDIQNVEVTIKPLYIFPPSETGK